MTQQVADVALRLGLVVVAQVRNGEGDVELADVLDGHDAAADAQLLGAERVLAAELSRVRAATLAGVPRATAIRSMAQRLDVPSLSTFSSALVHAENQGASIGDTLRRQATDLWSRRREEAIQKAQTLPTKLAFPLVICFLPGVFVWTFGPAVAEFVDLASSVLAERP